jgi:hypothetical protein
MDRQPIRSILASTLRTPSTTYSRGAGGTSLALWPSEAHDISRLVLKIPMRGRQCCPSAGHKNSRCQPENFCAHSRKYIGTQQGATNLRRILPTIRNCEGSPEGHHRTVFCIMRRRFVGLNQGATQAAGLQSAHPLVRCEDCQLCDLHHRPERSSPTHWSPRPHSSSVSG